MKIVCHLIVIIIAFGTGMLVQSLLPETYPRFFVRRLPQIEPIYGLRLEDGTNHPVIGKDEKGFVWTGGEFASCIKCHTDRWNGGEGPAFHCRLYWVDPDGPKTYPSSYDPRLPRK